MDSRAAKGQTIIEALFVITIAMLFITLAVSLTQTGLGEMNRQRFQWRKSR